VAETGSAAPGIMHTVASNRRAKVAGRALFDDETWDALAAELGVPARELEVTKCIFDGLTEVAIASRLKLSTSTVHTYVERLFHRFDVHDRVSLAIRIFAAYRALAARCER
jgi:DNA-binding NarL/FixJ family response regulator